MIRAIALTGGIAEGKSTVLKIAGDLGAKTASADELAKGVFDSGAVQSQLANLIGAEGPVDRSHLRQAIEQDSSLRRHVNKITHRAIFTAIKNCGAEIIEIPLLIETCLHSYFEQIWVVTCGADEQMTRLSARVGEQEARALIATQLPTRAKIPFANVVIRTNKPLASVQQDVQELQSYWIELRNRG